MPGITPPLSTPMLGIVLASSTLSVQSTFEVLESFDSSTAIEFHKWIHHEHHKNRYCLTYEAKRLICLFCDNPEHKYNCKEQLPAPLELRGSVAIRGSMERCGNCRSPGARWGTAV